jgi:hypothetical protein
MHYCRFMRSVLKSAVLIFVLSGAGKALAIPLTELKDNYQPIIDRNPFGLKPPPPPPTNNPTANVKEKPKLELFLTGITSVGFPRIPKQAYLMTKEQNKSTNYYALSEGIEKDGIKILSIDDIGRKVRIHTDEGEMMLSFQTHGIAPPASPKPGMPGAPPVPGQPVPGFPNQPGVLPGVPTPVQAQPINGAVQPGNTAYPNAGATRTIPARRVRAGTDNSTMNGGAVAPLPGAGGITPHAQAEMDPAEQYVRMHLNRAAAEKQGIPMPPLPIISQ